MKKKCIAILLAVLLITALPLSVNAFSDYFSGNKTIVKEVTCPNCHTQFTAKIELSYTLVHGAVQSLTYFNTAVTCPECGWTFIINNLIVPVNDLPGVKIK